MYETLVALVGEHPTVRENVHILYFEFSNTVIFYFLGITSVHQFVFFMYIFSFIATPYNLLPSYKMSIHHSSLDYLKMGFQFLKSII